MAECVYKVGCSICCVSLLCQFYIVMFALFLVFSFYLVFIQFFI
jgi:hypothetical protein